MMLLRKIGDSGIMTIQQKLMIACMKAEISQTELAKRLEMSQPSLSQRIKTGKFTEKELIKIGEALGAKYYSGFVFPDGEKIE